MLFRKHLDLVGQSSIDDQRRDHVGQIEFELVQLVEVILLDE
jgi:hypothetical protein